MLSSKRIKIFSNFYQKILHECKTFEEYLDIQNNHYNQLKININNINTTNKSINLNILFTRKPNNKQKLLLNKIIKKKYITTNFFFKKILSYLLDKIVIDIKISFPSKYPFEPPRWMLQNIKTNIKPKQIKLDKYYEYIIDKHNLSYSERDNWSPLYTIEKDIIIFIERINHFEFIN